MKHIDKIYHAGAGAVIALLAIFFVSFTNWSEFTVHVIAFCAVIAGGALKEYKDWKDYGKAFAQIADVEDFYTTIQGYDAGETQVLKHVNGALQWVTE